MPEIYKCPITQMPPIFPVVTNKGLTYEFTAIAEWMLQTEKRKDPILRDSDIVSLTINHALFDPNQTLSEVDYLEIAMLCDCLKHKMPKPISFETIISLPSVAKYITWIHEKRLLRNIMREGRVDCLHYVIENDFFTIDQLNRVLDEPVLCWLTRLGHTEMVKYLLALGLDPNDVNKLGESPLFIAVKHQQIAILEHLVTLPRVDVNAATTTHETAWHCAIRNGDIHCMHELQKRSDLQINKLSRLQSTPVWLAVFMGNTEILAFLLSLPAIDTTRANRLGSTPYSLAIKFRRQTCARMIRNAHLHVFFTQLTRFQPDIIDEENLYSRSNGKGSKT